MTSCDPQASNLDPENWEDFRKVAHDLLDQCINHLSEAREHPWQPVPEEIRASYAIDGSGTDAAELSRRLVKEVLPYATGNTHPRFFGWVHGTGLASGLLSEMVAATMNSNCGGRDHGMSYIERAVVSWCQQVFGFPETASGLLVAGTSQATVIGLAAARLRALGPELRAQGQQNNWLTAYAGASVHNATGKAIELLGIGHNNLRKIPETEAGMDLDILRARIREDRAAGAHPFAVIGTAGSVDLGRFDDLNGLALIAKEEDIWLHVDGAFGAWARLADAPWSNLVNGIERADSLACDFHKWMYVPYDCGLILIRDEAIHRATFAARPSYLAGQTRGLAGGDPWYCDYGIDLSRGSRALKVWTALQHYGPEKLGQAITRNCEQAVLMGETVSNTERMQLVAPVISNLCVFTADTLLSAQDQSRLNMHIVQELQLAGEVVFSTTLVDEVTCIRAAIANHRTTRSDITASIAAVARLR